jgi:tetratricopeptide (TPR) repeat protein
MRNAALLLLSGLMLAGCATDINMVNASRYHEAGLRAEWAGDYKAAETFFQRSLINARDGKASDSTISMAMYNLGRMKGLNCQYDEARSLLTDSLKLEEKISGQENALVTKRLFELARFSYDRQQYSAAADYYGRAIASGRKLGLAKDDPIALADAIDEYATALRNSGQGGAADAATADARALRMANPDAKAKYSFPRYNRSCAV